MKYLGLALLALLVLRPKAKRPPGASPTDLRVPIQQTKKPQQIRR